MSPDFERLVGRAVADEAFRKQLVSDPDGAVKDSGLNISADEMDRIRETVKNRGAELGSVSVDQVAAGEWR